RLGQVAPGGEPGRLVGRGAVRDGAGRGPGVGRALPTRVEALAVPPEVEPVRGVGALLGPAHRVVDVAVVVRGVELRADPVVGPQVARHPPAGEAGVRVAVDPVVAEYVAVAAGVDHPGPDRYADQRADGALVDPALGHRLGAGAVADEPVEVRVVVADDVVFDGRVVLRQAR